jgi:sporulation protein YlmC with PRC-barrel domain
MKKTLIVALAFVLTVSFGFAAYAKDTRSEDMSKAAQTDQMGTMKEGRFVTKAKTMDFRASDILGAKVENRNGDDLGKISDLAVDPKDGRVDFAVIGHGGVAGLGEKDFAVPLRSLTVRRDDNGKIKSFVLDMTKDQIANAPKFDQNSWAAKRS